MLSTEIHSRICEKDTYICSLHFVGNAGPTSDHPDPIPATATKYEVNKLMCMF